VLLKLDCVRPQLGRLLTAERSPVMADEDHHRGLIPPDVAQAHVAAFRVLHHYVREIRGGVHQKSSGEKASCGGPTSYERPSAFSTIFPFSRSPPFPLASASPGFRPINRPRPHFLPFAPSFDGSPRPRAFSLKTYQLPPPPIGAWGPAPACVCAKTLADSLV